MKSYVLLMAVVMLSFNSLSLSISNTERKRAVDHLMETQKRVMNTVHGLSQTEMDFKPTPTSWSVGECLEHLAISEAVFNQMLTGALEKSANPGKRGEVKMTDDQLMATITDRSNKVKTSEVFEPSGKYNSHKESLKAFNKQRNAHIKYMKKTEDDLRNHYGELPFGTIDGYQIMWFMSGHTERHVQQMEEVMQHDNFPKK